MFALLVILGSFALTIALSIPGAYVATDLWNWFVAPLLHVPNATPLKMYGLLLFTTFLRYSPSTTVAKRSLSETFILGAIALVILWVAGAIVHWLIVH